MIRVTADLLRTLGVASLLVVLCNCNHVAAQVVTPKDLEEQAKRFTRTTEMIPMRDGVKLYTMIYVPRDSKSSLPFIMMRTPYGSESRGPKAMKEYVKD